MLSLHKHIFPTLTLGLYTFVLLFYYKWTVSQPVEAQDESHFAYFYVFKSNLSLYFMFCQTLAFTSEIHAMKCMYSTTNTASFGSAFSLRNSCYIIRLLVFPVSRVDGCFMFMLFQLLFLQRLSQFVKRGEFLSSFQSVCYPDVHRFECGSSFSYNTEL